MQKELFRLTVQGLKKKKRISVLLFIVLTLSFSFSMLTLSLTESINKSNREYRLDTYGEWQAAVYGGVEEDRAEYESGDFEIGQVSCLGKLETGAVLGTIDPGFIALGRIGLQEGRFPEKADEIVMEASALSELGYNYQVGQKLKLRIELPIRKIDGLTETERVIEKEYTLSGIVRAYTNLWCTAENSELPSAIIANDSVESLYNDVEETWLLQKPVIHYFFSGKGTLEETIDSLKAYIPQGSKDEMRSLIANSYAYQVGGKADYPIFYIGLIFGVTVISVICLYSVQMNQQIRQISLFRSIGVTKRQLRFMLLYETLCLLAPAMLFGLLLGRGMIKFILREMIHFESEMVQVSYPVSLLIGIVVLWFVFIFVTRLVILQIALRQPLTSRMRMGGKRVRRYRYFKKILITGLAAIACGILFFSTIQGYNMRSERNEIATVPSYRFISLGTEEKISECEIDRIQEIPGITDVRAWGVISNVEMKFDHMNEEKLIHAFRENREMNSSEKYEGISVAMYGIREKDIDTFFNDRGIDKEKFLSGEQMVMLFPVNSENQVRIGEGRFSDTGIENGEEVRLGFWGNKLGVTSNGVKTVVGAEERLVEENVHITQVLKVKGDDLSDPLRLFTNPYNIICSENYLKKVLSQLPKGYQIGEYDTDVEFGYMQGEAYTSREAGYLSTDYVLADICSKKQIQFDNNREVNAARLQDIERAMIMYATCGGTIFLITLLIIWNMLSLAAEEEKRKIGILEAIGMSKAQIKVKNLAEAIKISVISATSGWLLFGVYLIYSAWNFKNYIWMTFEEKRDFYPILSDMIEGYKINGITSGLIFSLTLSAMVLIALVYYQTKEKTLSSDVLKLIREE